MSDRYDRHVRRALFRRIDAALDLDPALVPARRRPAVAAFYRRVGEGAGENLRAAKALRQLLEAMGPAVYLNRRAGNIYKTALKGVTCAGSIDEVIFQVAQLLPSHPMFALS